MNSDSSLSGTAGEQNAVTRRAWLTTTGTAIVGTAGMTGTALAGNGRPSRRIEGPPGMKIGLCSILSGPDWATETYRSMDEMLEIAADVGFYGIEPWGEDHVDDGTTETVREIKCTANRNRLRIPVYGSYITPGADGFEEAVDEELRIAHEMGADAIRIWPGTQEYGDHDEEHLEETIADLTVICDKARRKGLDVTAEKHEGNFTVNEEGCVRLYEAVDRSNFGINYHALFHLSPSELIEEASVLAPISNYVHLQGSPEPHDSDRRRIEDSYAPWEELLEIFRDSGYDGWISLEFTDYADTGTDQELRTALEADLDYLRSILESLQPPKSVRPSRK